MMCALEFAMTDLVPARDVSLSCLTILIAEDEALIAHDLAKTFEAQGAKVTTTNSLEHALLLADNDGLSAAIIDHALVDGDTGPLREKLSRLNIPFILYSGFDKFDDQHDGVHVPKPASVEKLIDTLLALFHGKSSRQKIK
jgi:DNA-binding response OmpR family regulator